MKLCLRAMRYKIGGENRVTKNWLNGGGKEKRKRKIRTEKDAELAASIRWIDHLYSAGGIASALHSNEAPENNNAVVSRSGPTELIVGGSAWKLNLLYRFSINVLSVEIKRKVLLTGFARTRNPGDLTFLTLSHAKYLAIAMLMRLCGRDIL